MDISSKDLRKSMHEPKIYALLVRSRRGQILHIGIHFSLEEAYGAARIKFDSVCNTQEGESVEIDLWNTITGENALVQLLEPGRFTLQKHTMDKSDKEIPIDSKISEPTPEYVSFTPNGFPPFIKDLMDSLDEPTQGIIDSNERTMMHARASVGEFIQDVKDTKNDLMHKLIHDGDVAQVQKLKEILGSNSIRYIIKAIEKKRNK